jgi:hypothetical protein
LYVILFLIGVFPDAPNVGLEANKELKSIVYALRKLLASSLFV